MGYLQCGDHTIEVDDCVIEQAHKNKTIAGRLCVTLRLMDEGELQVFKNNPTEEDLMLASVNSLEDVHWTGYNLYHMDIGIFSR